MNNMAKPANKHVDIREMSFEKALKELESIVGRLERGDVELGRASTSTSAGRL
jgi:exodeoxyribonuclease VII small subunit